ncbi:MAG TPA: outer membrane beta-barrel protein, partial [Pyrinomonadaceae bacterium]|nr:outer membrane beta-barrel protein [Pyrinomonadaceae bacterium]
MNRASQFSRLALMPCLLLLAFINVRAQEDDVPKVEVGGQFSSLGIRKPDVAGLFISATGGQVPTEPGFGGRITYNFNRHFALEAEGNFFPHKNFTDLGTGGRVLQGQFGVKAGKRFEKFGIFAKARPGFVSFSEALVKTGTETFDFGGGVFTFPVFGTRRKTYFSADVGGVIEFYPSRRIVTRFDAGDTIIRYGKLTSPFFFPGQPVTDTSHTQHNFQVSAGIGFRFFGPASSGGSGKDKADIDAGPTKAAPKFEVGAQFSSLSFRTNIFGTNFDSGGVSKSKIMSTELGFGVRLSYNLNDQLALEAEGNFFPRDSDFIAGLRGRGRVLQGQFGLKAGKRFHRFGIFGKARPGFVSFGTMAEFLGFNSNPDPFSTSGPFNYRIGRKAYFSTD